MENGWTYLPAHQADQARVDEPWGSLTWLASKPLADCEGVTMGRVIIHPGASNPRHSHPSCEEVLYLLAGRLEHWMGKQSVIMAPGDTIVVSRGIAHHARNIGDVDADMIVAYSSGQRDFRKED